MFVAEVQACIDEHAMLPPGATIIVAVSGGADSVALLSVLYRLCAVYGVRLVVAHVNHQLRGEESHRAAWDRGRNRDPRNPGVTCPRCLSGALTV